MFLLQGQDLSMEDVWRIAQDDNLLVQLSPEARARMQLSYDYILQQRKTGQRIYGVNTGFGALAQVQISEDQIIELQKNLVRSHACGVGQPLSRTETRAVMLLRANALAGGHSGVRPVVVDKILEFLQHNILPVIPSQGSVGASGDLAPLAHLALALIGEGEVWGEVTGEAGDGCSSTNASAGTSTSTSASASASASANASTSFSSSCQPIATHDVLRKHSVKPLELEAKEGLSLINGCQVMTAIGLLNAYEARRLLWMMDIAGAMSVEALRGTRSAFDPLIAASRPHHGEAQTARNLLRLLGGTKDASSSIAASHANCDRVQDVYSLRCMPAVHGAGKAALRQAVRVLETEANSSTDNPLVFADAGKILSCGNFHGEPVAFQMDFMAIAMTAMSSISQCRIEKMINPSFSGLPAFLAVEGGLNSGMMIVQYAAAALTSENKVLSHPACVDSIPTSAGKEDHVSMGTIAARKFGQIVRHAESIVAMEFLCATQALDLLKPLEPAPLIQKVQQCIRKEVPFIAKDRVFAKDVEKIRRLIRNENILKSLGNNIQLEW